LSKVCRTDTWVSILLVRSSAYPFTECSVESTNNLGEGFQLGFMVAGNCLALLEHGFHSTVLRNTISDALHNDQHHSTWSCKILY